MKLTQPTQVFIACLTALLPAAGAADLTRPLAQPSLVFEETDGIVAIEAEHFYKQTLNDQRAWHVVSSRAVPEVDPDGDPAHLTGASGGAYLECLPDTRRTHADKLIQGVNFSPQPGKMAVLHYKVHFNAPGRYHVWVRAYSTGGEDNGLHVGLDGQWPETGQRLQWCEGKNSWRWDSKQRTEAVHCGEPLKIFIDVPEAGEHEVMFSMREDGFEFDKFILTLNRNLERPTDAGPAPRVKAGQLPAVFAAVAAPATTAATAVPAAQKTAYPAHWGEPPQAQTSDFVPLPGGFGNGSSTLVKWIQQNLDKDEATKAAVGKMAAVAATPPPPRPPVGPALVLPRKADGLGAATVSGELKAWHKLTLTLDGPFAHELDNDPNPFTDLALTVTFSHASGSPKYTVPGYFAADGDASNSSADSGTKWRAHLSPDKPGKWTYAVSFVKGKDAALGGKGESVKPFNGVSGSFTVKANDKAGRDFRAKGRLEYVGKHHLQFAGTKEYFLKAGPDAPETMFAYVDFDGTQPGRKQTPRTGEAAPTQSLKTWGPHVGDWKAGDPTWQGGKGKGLIGALNYLSGKGVNAFSFLPYNAGGDGDNVWPFVEREDKRHYDCSKLDQWGIVFDHATRLGLYIHFKLQENEMDDDRRGHDSKPGRVPESLDGGKLGPERKLYCRELIARFGHALALNWNIGEENTQSTEEIVDMVRYLHDTDPYRHHIVIHTFPDQQDKVYTPLLGDRSLLTGASLQNSWSQAHQRTLKWLNESAKAGKPWVVANDEQNPASDGVPADPGYKGNDGTATQNGKKYTMHDVRKLTLWGTLLAGGAGVEYYFGYQLPENDLVCEDFRSRDKSWDYCRVALEFFRANAIPFWDMGNADALIGNAKNDNSKFCLAKSKDVYLVYLPGGGETELDLSGARGNFKVGWFNPRAGGALLSGSVKQVKGGGKVSLGSAPSDPGEDWAILVRK